jgi:hypothetical protein
MAKYKIEMSCGHTETHNIVGPMKSRDWKRQRIAERMCKECYRAAVERENARENAAAAEWAEENELPQLRGSEKQVDWAESIRREMLKELAEVKDQFEKLVTQDPGTEPELVDRARIGFEKIENETSAAWWIEHRNDVVRHLVLEVA